MTRTRIRTLLVAIGVGALLAGCGTPQAGAAAVVDGRRISVSDVQSATKDAQAYVDYQVKAQGGGQRVAVSQSQVLYLLAALPFIQQQAAADGVGVSENDARSVLLTSKITHPTRAGIQVVQANEALGAVRQLGEEKAGRANETITNRLRSTKFTVNPRYGSFDSALGRIVQVPPNWLKVIPTPTPSQ